MSIPESARRKGGEAIQHKDKKGENSKKAGANAPTANQGAKGGFGAKKPVCPHQHTIGEAARRVIQVMCDRKGYPRVCILQLAGIALRKQWVGNCACTKVGTATTEFQGGIPPPPANMRDALAAALKSLPEDMRGARLSKALCARQAKPAWPGKKPTPGRGGGFKFGGGGPGVGRGRGRGRAAASGGGRGGGRGYKFVNPNPRRGGAPNAFGPAKPKAAAGP